jgi:cysteinyl-tRNA synthetase
MIPELRLYNTLTKQKELFVPLHTGKVGLYTCGPTVYGPLQIGNWRAYTFADTLRRTLEQFGLEVRHIENITDVGHLTDDDVAQGDSGEDKMVKKALAEKKTPLEIADQYLELFHKGEELLNILPAHFYPRATAHIDHMIGMIKILIEKGHAYEVNGAVFYDVTTFKNYGKLSGNTLENLEVGARLEAHPDKRNPWDFALWLPAPKEHLMHWASPWSEGYPGWHIECSAMSQEYLGDTFDIHTGGEDNIFPHHEAEIAQSEAETGKPFVRYWLHTRHLLVNGEKMAKSKGTSYTLEDIQEKGFSSANLRMAFLGAHYRSQMNFTWESLEQAKKNKEKLFGIYHRLLKLGAAESNRPVAGNRLTEFLSALADDLNTPLALAEALRLATADNKEADAETLTNLDEKLADWQIIFSAFGLTNDPSAAIPQEVQKLAEDREQARAEKNWSLADEYRQALLEKGYEVKDTTHGFELTKI